MFFNDTLDKNRDSPNIYALNYMIFSKTCELIQTMNKISGSFSNPTTAEISSLSKLWKNDIAWGFYF